MKLPHGRPENHRGRPVIAVTYDPNDKTVTPKHTKRYVITTKEGRLYEKLTREAEQIRHTLAELEYEWNSTYRHEPVNIKFPLHKKSYTGITKDEFMNGKPNQNKREFDNEIFYNGQRLRSKNEIVVCQAFEKMGYEYKAELLIQRDEFYSFAPDLTYYIKELEKPVALEIDGAMDKDGYFEKATDRKKYYVKKGFKEFKDVVFFRLNDGRSFDYDRLEAIINATILANLNDIILSNN
ncbi:MAG: hypothetical protein J6127_04515 [Clostridiales bacterium]|nr:hypothetical protein [Clostridiales bacterium]